MTLRFSERPGPRERHLARRWNNPLFGTDARAVTQADIEAAASADRDELGRFMASFQHLVRRATELPPNEESEVVLELKGQLEKAYVECMGLPGNQGPVCDAVARLIDAIMAAVRRAAAGDPTAEAELDGEDSARRQHRKLLRFALVSDLMRPDSPVSRDELAPTLLSEPPEAVAAALWLFEPAQIAELHRESLERLKALRTDGHELTAAWASLAELDKAHQESS